MKKKDSATKKFLKGLAIVGGVVTCSILSPMLPSLMLKAYIKDKQFQRKKWLEDLKRLQRRDLISLTTLPDGQIQIELSDRGRKSTLTFDFDLMQIARPTKWDRKWRLVMFDIPSSMNKARDAIRFKLKTLGFYQLQKSVFIFPFPCEKEIDFIGALFDVRDKIILMHISTFDGEEKIRHKFKLI